MRRFAQVVRGLVALLAALSLALLAMQASRFQASRPGTSAEYWEYLCGVQLSEFSGHFRFSYRGDAYPVIGDQAHYVTQRHHDQLLFSVPLALVLQDLPQVRARLQHPVAPRPTACGEDFDVCRLFERSAPKRSECARLLSDRKISTADDLELLRVEMTTQSNYIDASFRDRLARGQRAWITFAFEALYLVAWLMFVAGIRPLRCSWRWRAGAAPFLLFLPYFLGYAPMTFTFGPTGGFVYPMYLMLASLPMKVVPCSAADQFIWPFFPQFLGDLSQLPGSPMAASQMACVGPASSVAFGALVVAIVCAVLYVANRWKKAREA